MTEEGKKTIMGTRRPPPRAANTVWAVKAVGGNSPPSGGCVAARSVTRRTLSFRSSAPAARQAAGGGGNYRSQEAPRGPEGWTSAGGEACGERRGRAVSGMFSPGPDSADKWRAAEGLQCPAGRARDALARYADGGAVGPFKCVFVGEMAAQVGAVRVVRAVAAQEEPDKEGKEKPHAGVSPRGVKRQRRASSGGSQEKRGRPSQDPPLPPSHRRRRSRQHPGPLPPTNAAPTLPGPVEPLLLPPPPPPSLAPAGPAVAAPLPAPGTSALFTFSPLTVSAAAGPKQHKGHKERHRHHHHRGSDGGPSSCVPGDLRHKDKQENGERAGGVPLIKAPKRGESRRAAASWGSGALSAQISRPLFARKDAPVLPAAGCPAPPRPPGRPLDRTPWTQPDLLEALGFQAELSVTHSPPAPSPPPAPPGAVADVCFQIRQGFRAVRSPAWDL